MKNFFKLIIVASSFVFAGCATNQGVVELTQVNTPVQKITVVKDEPTRESVLPVLLKWLDNHDVSYSVVNSLNETKSTDPVLTYRANWSWDMALYMRKAELKVSQDGIPVGIAKFDALQYGGFGKFGDAEARLNTLMDVLFAKISRDEANKELGKN